MSRESDEVGEKQHYDQFLILDVCIHGNYPNETDCGCTENATAYKVRQRLEPVNTNAG